MLPAHRLFSRTMAHWFWDYYDHMILMMVVNVALFLSIVGGGFFVLTVVSQLLEGSPPALILLVLFLCFIILAPLAMTLWLAPLAYYGELIAREKKPGWGDWVFGLQRYGLRGLKYFSACGLALGLLLINLWFYWSGPGVNESIGMARFFIAGIGLWITLFAILVMLIGVPIYFRSNKGVKASLLTAVGVFFRSPGFFILLSLWIAGIWVIGTFIKMVGLILFTFAMTAVLFNAAYDVLLEEEERLDRAAEPEKQITSWADRAAVDRKKEQIRMKKLRYERTIRDIFRPWEP